MSATGSALSGRVPLSAELSRITSLFICRILWFYWSTRIMSHCREQCDIIDLLQYCHTAGSSVTILICYNNVTLQGAMWHSLFRELRLGEQNRNYFTFSLQLGVSRKYDLSLVFTQMCVNFLTIEMFPSKMIKTLKTLSEINSYWKE